MPTLRMPAAAIAALCILLVLPAAANAVWPAAANAASPAVRAKALHQPSVYENWYTVVYFEYQCPAGATATVFASISQAGTGAYYDSSSPFEREPTLVCDGEKHRDDIGLVSLGYDENSSDPYDEPYLQDTAQGYGRGTVTVTVTASGRQATDVTRVTVQSRDA